MIRENLRKPKKTGILLKIRLKIGILYKDFRADKRKVTYRMPKNIKQLEFDIRRVQDAMNISDKSVKNCAIPMEELEKIYYDYLEWYPKLDKLRIEILGALNKGVTGDVHSIRSRTKEPDHLIAKIIRGTYRNPAKYQKITVDNYQKIVTDLIGVRIIILDRRNWRNVHEDMMQVFRNIPERYIKRQADLITNYDKYAEEVMAVKKGPDCSYHAERPVAYIASESDRKLYRDEFLRLDSSKANYRSIHYIIRYKEVYFEVQMRSLFEEGWLEFDHVMKYPNDQFNKRKQEYINILSNLANAADQLISYYEEDDFKETGDKEEDAVSNYRSVQGSIDEDMDLEEKMRQLF